MVKNRFIAFVGNLPFDTTKEDLQSFLKCLGDVEIRMNFEENGKFKGFCFVECSDNEQFQKLIKMHHLKVKGRKVNIELSAGGGGNSKSRKNRIKEKNQKIQKYRKSLHSIVKKTVKKPDSENKKQET
jgi:RNA recognition motif.